MPKDITQTQIDFLNLLKQSPDQFHSLMIISKISGQEITKTLKQLAELEKWGYHFEFNDKKEIKFSSAPDIFFPHEIQDSLNTNLFNKEIYSYDKISSTNKKAFKYAESGEAEGTLLIADQQLAGKGRLGRNWHSPPKVGIFLSMILRPKVDATTASGLSLLLALALVEVLRKKYQQYAEIKWPNDIHINGRKIAGILTEVSTSGSQVKFVVIGIGINVNHQSDHFPADIKNKAVSLRMLTNNVTSRVELLQDLLLAFEEHYQDFIEDGLLKSIDKIRKYSSLLNHQITFNYQGSLVNGEAIDIDNLGRLLVKTPDKDITLNSGEVTLADNY